MTRLEKIAALYVSIYRDIPTNEQLDQYVQFNEFISLEVISSTMMNDSLYKNSYIQMPTEDLVKVMFQEIFDLTNEQMQVIINEQEQIAQNGGISGFQYWVNEIENNPFVTINTLPIAIINGTSQDDEASILNQIEEILNAYMFSQSYENTGLGDLANFSSLGVSSLDSSSYWDDSTTALTFSFNEYIPDSYYEYGSELYSGFEILNEIQRDVVRDIFNQIESIIGLNFVEIPDNGDIRFSLVSQEDSAAFAFYPNDSYDYAGDVFLSTDFNIPNLAGYDLTQGRYGWSTIVHELGHSLGLEHPFDDGDNNAPHLPTDEDDFAHTIMSYTGAYNFIPEFTINYNRIDFEYIDLQPNLYSVYDLNALQWKYGVNDTTNLEDNVYTINYTDFIFETIWDAGGTDTFDLRNNIGNTTLDLNFGSLNSIDEYSYSQIVEYFKDEVNDSRFDTNIENVIEDLYLTDKLYMGINNLGIATGVIIENVYTGSGNDVITDNLVDNIIDTGAGNDTIILGNGGYDKIDGGTGYDRISFESFSSSEMNFEEKADSTYILYNQDYAVEFTNIELIEFSNQNLSVYDLLV
jgi:hypothetical protein